MSDLFETSVPDEYIARVFAVMALAGRHTFQVLTKRPGRMRSLLSSDAFADPDEGLLAQWVYRLSDSPCVDLGRIGLPLPNVWLGTSIESQREIFRMTVLRGTPAAVRFLSLEPLLGPITFDAELGDLDGIGWAIAGGESGRGARPMHLDWARSLRDQCVAARVPFLFKQWGEWAPTKSLTVGYLSDPREAKGELVDDGLHPGIEWRRLYRRVGKKAAGRELDGRTWDEYPAGVS
jgi:protein gp37